MLGRELQKQTIEFFTFQIVTIKVLAYLKNTNRANNVFPQSGLKPLSGLIFETPGGTCSSLVVPLASYAPAHPVYKNLNSYTQIFDPGSTFIPQDLLYLDLFTPWSLQTPLDLQRPSGLLLRFWLCPS